MAPKIDNFGLSDPTLLKKIDKLFACNVGHHIDLPLIVVVGNQSSGKSSVLEGLTNLPFPKDSGLCTRFATQIIFRRTEKPEVKVSISPAKDSSAEHKEKCRQWSSVRPDFNPKAFVSIMHEVNEVMGISGSANPPKTFSEDVLLLECNGPDKEHLSVIDVPGIFMKAEEGKTTKSDRDLVNRLVESYVKNPRCIILAVVPANVDIATQGILDLAESHDPHGSRTLGVLTKPDLVDAGAEKMVLDLLNDKAHRLTLGWCIVRNLGQKESEDKSKKRSALERDFFQNTSPWNQVKKDKAGVDALKHRLGRLLLDHTKREFPKVRSELDRLLKTSRTELEGLGSSRTTTEEQREFLTNIATSFQDISRMALEATYWVDSVFEENENMRLATKIVNRNEIFAKRFDKYGHLYEFRKPDEQTTNGADKPSTAPETAGYSSESDSGEEPRARENGEKKNKGGRTSVSIRLVDDPDDLIDMLQEKSRIQLPIPGQIQAWLDELYTGSRGFEIGTFSPGLLASTMKAQSSKWDRLCLGYISDIIAMTHRFLTELLKYTCPDERVRAELGSLVADRFTEGYRNAMDQVQYLLFVERCSTPLTMNHYFNDMLQKSRKERLAENLKNKVWIPKGEENPSSRKAVWCDEILSDTSKMDLSNREHIVQDMHDILQSYYKVARKRVVDNVIKQSVDFELLSGPRSPLRVLTSRLIGSLSSEQLDAIAGEDEFTKRRREELKTKIAELESGRKILQ